MPPKVLVLQCVFCIVFPLNEVSISELFLIMEVYCMTSLPSQIIENYDSAPLFFLSFSTIYFLLLLILPLFSFVFTLLDRPFESMQRLCTIFGTLFEANLIANYCFIISGCDAIWENVIPYNNFSVIHNFLTWPSLSVCLWSHVCCVYIKITIWLVILREGVRGWNQKEKLSIHLIDNIIF